MIFLRVHGKISIFASPIKPFDHWTNNPDCPGPRDEALDYPLSGNNKNPVYEALRHGWLFGATRKQFRKWWPRIVLDEFVTWDSHAVSLIYCPPGACVKTKSQVIFDPNKARVIRTLTKEQVIYLTRRDRKCPRKLKKELFR